jgi:hypothetical protein
MSIAAIALLRVTAPLASQVSVQPLEDGVLVQTGLDFAEEPEVLSSALHALLGRALLAEHDDPRGVFFIPGVAAPKSRRYDAVIEEVGEGGLWGPLPTPQLTAAGENLQALLGNLLGGLPPSLAAAGQDPAALRAATPRMHGLLEHPAELEAMLKPYLPQLNQLLAGAGVDLNSPDMQRMAEQMQAELEHDPKRLADFAEQLFAEGAGGSEHQDEDEED